MLNCLTNIVGVTESDCPCVVDGLTTEQKADIKKSTSGLYMDTDLNGGITLQGLNTVDACKDMADLALESIVAATKKVEEALIVMVGEQYEESKKPFTGKIGKYDYAQSLPVSKPMHGIQIVANDANTLLTIRKMDIIVNGAMTTDIGIYKGTPGNLQLVKAFNTTTTANTYTVVFSEDEKLPFIDESGNKIDYYILYAIPEGVQPKDNTLRCAPCEKQNGSYMQYINVMGLQADSTETGIQNIVYDAYSHGLVLDIQLKCDTSNIFCDKFEANNAVAIVLANATLYKAGQILIQKVLSEPSINRYTTMDRDYLMGRASHFEKQFNERMKYLAQKVDLSDSNCYVCRQAPNKPYISTILA